MRKFASTLNKATGTRLIEKGSNQKINAPGKTLQDFFQHSVVKFATTKRKTEEQKHIMHCKNLEDLNFAKNFPNVIHSSFINMDNLVLILDVIPPFQLHLLLGIVKNLSDLWPGAKERPAELHFQLQPYHGGHFKGNDFHKLLKNIDIPQ